MAFDRRTARSSLLALCALAAPAALVAAQEQSPSPVAAQAIAPPPDLHRYPLPTYEEDWRGLRDVARHDDRWDVVKLVLLSADGTTSLSLGGEARMTYERFGNQNFGLTAPDPDGYLLQRYMFHVDLRAGSRVRVWTEFNSGLEHGRVGGPRPVIDEDKLGIHQAFVDAIFGVVQSSGIGHSSSLLVRIGRQEIAVGSGRLYALREGPNVPLSFDGLRVIAHAGAWRLDGWAARPVMNKPGVFDDASHSSFNVWGVYGSRVVGPSRRTVGLDVYYLGLAHDAVHFDQGTGNETRHTVGARAWHQGVWGYDGEGMFQFGRFGRGDIRAWRFVAEGSRLIPTIASRPRFDLVLDVASGDRNPADPNLQTFNAMFQSGTYSGRAQLLGPNNSIRFEPSVVLAPLGQVSVSAGWGFYWRESIHDALYGIPGQVIVPSNGGTDRYEGSRPIAQVDWQLTRHLSAHANYIYVFNGRFEEKSVHGTSTMSFVSPWVTYRF
jgi:hypothetical protein